MFEIEGEVWSERELIRANDTYIIINATEKKFEEASSFWKDKAPIL
jgi:hypothetical protein